jgi:hypothetical protein
LRVALAVATGLAALAAAPALLLPALLLAPLPARFPGLGRSVILAGSDTGDGQHRRNAAAKDAAEHRAPGHTCRDGDREVVEPVLVHCLVSSGHGGHKPA